MAPCARLTDLSAQKERLAVALDASQLPQERAQTELRSLQDRWIALWADCGTDPGTPTEMLIWLRHRDEVVRMLTASRQER